MDMFVIMVVMLVNCMQTVYLAFVLSNKRELPVFIDYFTSVAHLVKSCIFQNKSELNDRLGTITTSRKLFILSNHTNKQAGNFLQF